MYPKNLLFVLASSGFLPALAVGQQFAPLPRRYLADVRNAYAVAAGDVDRDGDTDLIVGRHLAPAELHLNDGRGRFTLAPRALPSTATPLTDLAAGDVDGDGDLDVVVASYMAPPALWRNDGAGRFRDDSTRSLPSLRDPSIALVLADLDSDSDPDVVLVNDGVPCRLLRNDGTGRFRTATGALPGLRARLSAAAAFDADRDGDLDLLLVGAAAARLWTNDGKGVFSEAAGRVPAVTGSLSAVASGDLDRDGDPDVLVGRDDGAPEELWLNDGKGTFVPARPGRLPRDDEQTYAVLLGDLDADADLDVICVNGNGGQCRSWLNDGRGVFRDATADTPADIDYGRDGALFDADADGDLDVAIVCDRTNSRLWFCAGKARFVNATPSRLPRSIDYTLPVVQGDVDGDGRPDVVFGNWFSRNRIHLGDGEGRLRDAPAAALAPDIDYTRGAALGDLDGDGDLDLVFGNYPEPDRVHLNDGRGRFTDVTATHLPGNGRRETAAVALGDLDGDGDLDLVAACDDTVRNRLYLNDGKGRFEDRTSFALPRDHDYSTAVALGDVDGDGDLDIVFGNERGRNRLLRNNGKAMFADVSATNLPADTDDTLGVALVDVDGDGDLDLAVANTGAPNRLLRNDGKGRFTDVTPTHLPGPAEPTTAVAFGDVDGDGDPDLVFANDPGQDRLYLNDGKGRFTDVSAARMPVDRDQTTSVVLVDLDEDGDLDLVRGRAQDANGIYLNRHRQIHAPWFLRTGDRFRLAVEARPGYARRTETAYIFVGVAPARPALRLGAWGLLKVDPGGLVALPAVSLPAPAGHRDVDFAIPADRGLIGRTLYWQALVTQDGGLARAHFTNLLTERILD